MTEKFITMQRFIATLLLVLASAVQAEEANYFLLTYSAGSGWNEAIAYEEQPGLKQHHAYLEQLHRNDTLVMGGVVPDLTQEFLSIMILRTGSLEEAETIARQDPGVAGKIIRANVIPWNVEMTSMRFVRRKPMPVISDPDQSFSIKRVDPETRLNLED